MAAMIPLSQFTDWHCAGCGANLLTMDIQQYCKETRRYEVQYVPAQDTFERFRDLHVWDLDTCSFSCPKCNTDLTAQQAELISEEL